MKEMLETIYLNTLTLQVKKMLLRDRSGMGGKQGGGKNDFFLKNRGGGNSTEF